MEERRGGFTGRGHACTCGGQWRRRDYGVSVVRRLGLSSKPARHSLGKVLGRLARRAKVEIMSQVVVRWYWFDLEQRRLGRSAWLAIADAALVVGLSLAAGFALLVIGCHSTGTPLPWELMK